MKRLFTVMFMFIACGCIFTACEEEPIEYKYRLHNDSAFEQPISEIVIFERDNNGKTINKRSIYKLEYDSYSETYTASEEVTDIDIYYIGKDYFNDITYNYSSAYTLIFERGVNTINVDGDFGDITREQYEFETQAN